MAERYEVVLRISTTGPTREYKRKMTVRCSDDMTFQLLLGTWMRGDEPVKEDKDRVKVNIPSEVYSARTMTMEIDSATAPDGRDVKAIAKEAIE